MLCGDLFAVVAGLSRGLLSLSSLPMTPLGRQKNHYQALQSTSTVHPSILLQDELQPLNFLALRPLNYTSWRLRDLSRRVHVYVCIYVCVFVHIFQLTPRLWTMRKWRNGAKAFISSQGTSSRRMCALATIPSTCACHAASSRPLIITLPIR